LPDPKALPLRSHDPDVKMLSVSQPANSFIATSRSARRYDVGHGSKRWPGCVRPPERERTGSTVAPAVEEVICAVHEPVAPIVVQVFTAPGTDELIVT